MTVLLPVAGTTTNLFVVAGEGSARPARGNGVGKLRPARHAGGDRPARGGQEGLTEWLATAAINNAPVYGAIAVSVAMSLGFGLGFSCDSVPAERRSPRAGRRAPDRIFGRALRRTRRLVLDQEVVECQAM